MSAPELLSCRSARSAARTRLQNYALDDLHQIASAEWADTGVLYRLANFAYRVHVDVLVTLMLIGRRWHR